MASEERTGPRERLAEVGAERLGDADLLAVLLGTGARGEPVGVLAARLMEESGGLAGLERMGVGALSRLPGIGRSKAARVVAALEIGRRVASSAPRRGERIGSSRDVDALLRPPGLLGSPREETFCETRWLLDSPVRAAHGPGGLRLRARVSPANAVGDRSHSERLGATDWVLRGSRARLV